jgi:hypothetical protein
MYELSHSPSLDHYNYTIIWRKAQVIMLPIMQFSPALYNCILFQSKFHLSTLFLNNLSLCSSLNISNQISHPHITTDKIIISYISIFYLIRQSKRRKILIIVLYTNKLKYILSLKCGRIKIRNVAVTSASLQLP